MYLGKLKFYDEKKGFGFISKENKDYYLCSSVVKGRRVSDNEYLMFDFVESKRHRGKFNVNKISFYPKIKANQSFDDYLNSCELKEFFNTMKYLTYEEIAILKSKNNYTFIKFIEKIAKNEFDINIEKYNLEVTSILNSIDINKFIETIEVSVEFHYHVRPGNDDWESTSAKAISKDYEIDKYLSGLLRVYGNISLKEEDVKWKYKGYMGRELHEDTISELENRIPKYKKDIQKSLISAYNKEKHFNLLIEEKKENFVEVFKEKFDFKNNNN